MTLVKTPMVSKKRLAVRIAKDALEQIREEKVIPEFGVYARSKSKVTLGDLQAQLHKVDRNCKVCALGSLFLSAVRLKDQFVIEGFDRNNGCLSLSGRRIREFLARCFSPSTLSLIETAFEGGRFCIHLSYVSEAKRHAYYEALDKAVDFHKICVNCNGASDNPTHILKAILENIIKNNGDFVP